MKFEIWFEFASTYSYLSIMRVEPLLRQYEIDFVWRPFLLGPIFRQKGMPTSPFVMDEIKGAYMWRDVERQAQKYGLPFQKPTNFPMNSLTASRVMTAALNESWCSAFARSVFKAQFGDARDISDMNTIRQALEDCGVDADYWLGKAALKQTKQTLRKHTEQAQSYGIFGAPTFRVDSELFWGDDRLENAIDWWTMANAQG